MDKWKEWIIKRNGNVIYYLRKQCITVNLSWTWQDFMASMLIFMVPKGVLALELLSWVLVSVIKDQWTKFLKGNYLNCHNCMIEMNNERANDSIILDIQSSYQKSIRR